MRPYTNKRNPNPSIIIGTQLVPVKKFYVDLSYTNKFHLFLAVWCIPPKCTKTQKALRIYDGFYFSTTISLISVCFVRNYFRHSKIPHLLYDIISYHIISGVWLVGDGSNQYRSFFIQVRSLYYANSSTNLCKFIKKRRPQ